MPRKRKERKIMKQGNTKIAYTVIFALLVIMMCVGLVLFTAANRTKDDVPAMAEGEEGGTSEAETEEAEPETETDTETETETEAETETEPEPVDLSSKGLEFCALGNGTCYVTGLGVCRDSTVILPYISPEGDRVVGIGEYAFRNCTYMREIILHENIRYIGEYGFYGSGLEAVYIPAATEWIGDYAFTNCGRLMSITVDDQNSFYCDIDGVLYSKDMRTIITCPQGKNVSNFSITSQVSEIRTMAFYHCDSIKLVNYEGGAASFRRIQIGAGNEPIESAIVSFSGAVSSVTGNTAVQKNEK